MDVAEDAARDIVANGARVSGNDEHPSPAPSEVCHDDPAEAMSVAEVTSVAKASTAEATIIAKSTSVAEAMAVEQANGDAPAGPHPLSDSASLQDAPSPADATSPAARREMEGTFYREDGGVMVFKPTLDDMRDFPRYIEYMEEQGAHLDGIAKVRGTCWGG